MFGSRSSPMLRHFYVSFSLKYLCLRQVLWSTSKRNYNSGYISLFPRSYMIIIASALGSLMVKYNLIVIVVFPGLHLTGEDDGWDADSGVYRHWLHVHIFAGGDDRQRLGSLRVRPVQEQTYIHHFYPDTGWGGLCHVLCDDTFHDRHRGPRVSTEIRHRLPDLFISHYDNGPLFGICDGSNSCWQISLYRVPF